MDNITDSNISIEDQSPIHQLLNVPDFVGDFNNAKMYLQQISPETGDNLYDHLSEVLNKILAERPQNVVDFFEEYSRKVKEDRYRSQTDIFQEIYIEPERYEFIQRIMPMLKPQNKMLEEAIPEEPDDNQLDATKRDMMNLLYYCDKAGIILPKTDFYYLELSMKELAKVEKLLNMRLWGIIYGIDKNYIVVEAELSEEMNMERNRPPEPIEDIPIDIDIPPKEETDEPKPEAVGEDGTAEPVKISKIPRALPPLPVAQYTRPEPAPNELSGEGANKKIYYVCNEPGEKWTQLPDVTPEEIRVARQIIRSFSGDLNREVITYPKFPGPEINYLRAQIARISAGTQISPLGYYTFKSGEGMDEEEEEEVGEEVTETTKTSYTINKLYEPHSLQDLTDMSMAFWVHHTLYILPQGRTTWWNPMPKSEEKGMDEMGEEEEESVGGDRPEPETGPTLLTALSEDASLETIPPWTVQASSALLPEHAVAIVRSNLWPGAFAFSLGKYYDNIYIGYGHKHIATNFSPVPLPYVQEEYPQGPEITEITDPTAAMEEEWRIAHEKKPPEPKAFGEEMGEGVGEGEAPEGDDDEDDDD